MKVKASLLYPKNEENPISVEAYTRKPLKGSRRSDEGFYFAP